VRILPLFDGGRGRRADIRDSSSGCAPLRSSYTVAAGRQTARRSRHSRCTSGAACLSPATPVPAIPTAPLTREVGECIV
jgi:hypothetical protein